ncbi:MAG: MOSC domain-containing protein [Pseudomonadales bacterium]|nr:MOSC domain-containing protein [Pseudomonadales bacterium]
MKTLSKLLSRYMPTAPTGRVEWIGVRPERKAPVIQVTETVALEDRGLKGDRSALKASNSGRQVTLISAEDIQALATTLGRNTIDPAILRRNIVVSGINLHAMRYQNIRIGEAILEVGAHCHPCSRMESALGKGGFLAMYMRGGYCCKVTHSGLISVGDSVTHHALDNNATDQQGQLF